jgi:hypothetical protein
MARGLTSLSIVLLLASVPGFGQIIIPGGRYPGGGYPGQRYPQGGSGGPAQGRQSTATTLTGILRNMGDKNVVIEADDKTITTISIANSTKYFSTSGGSAKVGDFQPGDHVSIGTNQDNKNAYHAVKVTMVREGTPEEHSIASLAADDTSHPLPNRSADGSASASSATNSSSGSAGNSTTSAGSSGGHPTLQRAASSSDNSSRTAGSSSSSSASGDDGRPVLRRATSSPDDTPQAQVASGDSATTAAPAPPSSARPSLHAGDVGGVTQLPAQPQLDAATEGNSPRGPRMPQGMPATEDPFIDQTREAAFAFSETLPNYVVKQFTTRYVAAVARGGRTSWQALDNVTADVIEEDGAEKYKNILVNGRPPLRDVEKTGSWSRGEFSSLLQDVLSPRTDADFFGKRSTTMVNRAAFRYDFSVEQPNSHWHVEAESESYMPAYTGSIWIDKENYRVLRIEMSAQRMPSTFPFDQVEWAVDYDYVFIAEGKYLLPVHSETLSCARATSQCTRNVIEFRNYKKFTADTSITFDTDK